MRKYAIILVLVTCICVGCSNCDYENCSGDESESGEIPVIEEKELFEEYYDEAEKIMNSMSLEEKVGQMFLARYNSETALDDIENLAPGGYVLFGVDFKNKTKQDVISEIKALQDNSKINLLLAVDEEGGTVVRVSAYENFRDSKFKSPRELIDEGGLEALLSDSTEKSTLLKSLGLNMNLAPVVDVPTNENSFMYKRALGTDASTVSYYTDALINRMNNDGIISCLKHFPGYGDNVDTHTGIAIDEREYTLFISGDLLPFMAGIKANVPAIMMNHNIVNCVDNKWPASLSETVHSVLRDELDYSGLILTDALDMDAVKEYVENGSAAVQAVIAGNDLIISSTLQAQRDEVLNAVLDGRITEDRINDSVRRILACKMMYGII